jgi:hypothetical protein
MASDFRDKIGKDYSFDPVLDPQVLHNAKDSPELKLIRAMFERAMLDLTGSNARDKASAECWIFSAEDPNADLPFSFEWGCYHLSWCPIEIRKKFSIRLQESKVGLYNLEETRRETAVKGHYGADILH